MRRRIPGTILLSGLLVCRIWADGPPKPELGPVQAELVARLNVRHLAQGDAVLAKVTADWNGAGCALRRGAILSGKVEAAARQTVGNRESKIAVSFSKAQCNGNDLAPFELVLGAVAAPPAEWTNALDPGVFPSSYSNPFGAGQAIGGSNAAPYVGTTHMEFVAIHHSFPFRSEMHPGDVLDMKGLKLGVGTGPERSSVLISRDRDVFLDAYTQLLLVPASLAFQPAGVKLGTNEPAGVLVPRPPVAPPVDNFETCAPPGCAVDLPVSEKELAGSAANSIAIAPLGYVLRPQRVLSALDNEEALSWLGPSQLLLTFNPHTLIKRNGPAANGAPVRLIRAVLFDTRKRAIARAVDWEVADWGRYLWPMAEGRVLVHVGNELRVYSAGLEVQSRIPLAGALAFVRMAPNGQLMAVGTVAERHSEDLHLQLRESSGEEPEEDVDVNILNSAFQTIGHASTTSHMMPPTLLNEGQVKLLAQPHAHFRLAMGAWDNKTATLARFESHCRPELSSFGPDLLFLVTCPVPDAATEFRVLRADGKVLLRGTNGPQDLGQEAAGSSEDKAFALKVIRASRKLSAGQDFQSLDLESERVQIYRASDGKRLFAARVDQPAASYNSYALSPDGSQLAVLAGSQIRFFPVPAV